MNIRFLKSAFVVICVAMIAACGGKKAANSEVVAAPKGDITRPPKVAKTDEVVAEELNPNETISFDEWRRKKAEEQQKSSDQ